MVAILGELRTDIRFYYATWTCSASWVPSFRHSSVLAPTKGQWLITLMDWSIYKSIQYSDNKSSEYSIHTDIDKNEHAQFSGQCHYIIKIKMFQGSHLRPLLGVMFLLNQTGFIRSICGIPTWLSHRLVKILKVINKWQILAVTGFKPPPQPLF